MRGPMRSKGRYSSKPMLSSILLIALSIVPCFSEWRGADISMLPDVEQAQVWANQETKGDNYNFKNRWGQVQDVPDLLRDNNFNIIRIHLFYEPDGICCNTWQAIELAKRVRDVGMDIILDFHFSDDWANPGIQEPPKAWRHLRLDQLSATIKQYTRETMNDFRDANIDPIAVQLGNEMAGVGFLHPIGKIWGDKDNDYQWRNLGFLLGNATQGLRDSYAPMPKVILHTHHGADYERCQWFFTSLLERTMYDDYDIIGLSFYPWFQGTISGLRDNIPKLRQTFAREVAVVETGYPWTLHTNDRIDNNYVRNRNQLHDGYPATKGGQRRFVRDVRQVVQETGGLGVLYWEPEWISVRKYETRWENGALFDFEGDELPALEEMGRPLRSLAATAAPPMALGDWRGADVSRFHLIQQGGGIFRNAQGQEQWLPKILKDNGINLGRIRLFHSPPAGECCNLKQAVDLAKDLKYEGISVVIDFHYSDEWSTASQQNKPKAWRKMDLKELGDALQTYTRDAMQAFHKQDIFPVAVQLGNEIGGGILWPEGQIWDNSDTAWNRLGFLLRKARQGVRDASSWANPQIIIHHERGADMKASGWFYWNLIERARFDDFDVMGLSFYPYWHGELWQLNDNLRALANRYDKYVAVMETAYPCTLASNDNDNNNAVKSRSDLHPGYPATERGQRNFIRDLRNHVKAIPKGLGVIYMAPDWIVSPWYGSTWENMALFGYDGRALPGLAALGGRG